MSLRVDATQVVVHAHQFQHDRRQQPTGLGVFVDPLEELDHRQSETEEGARDASDRILPAERRGG